MDSVACGGSPGRSRLRVAMLALLQAVLLLPSASSAAGSLSVGIVSDFSFHYEILAGYMHLVSQLPSATMEVYLQRRTKDSKGGIKGFGPSDFGFQHLVAEHKDRMHDIPCKLQLHDLLIFISPEYNVTYVKECIAESQPKQVLLVIHNADAWNLPALTHVHPRMHLVVLAPHVLDYLVVNSVLATGEPGPSPPMPHHPPSPPRQQSGGNMKKQKVERRLLADVEQPLGDSLFSMGSGGGQVGEKGVLQQVEAALLSDVVGGAEERQASAQEEQHLLLRAEEEGVEEGEQTWEEEEAEWGFQGEDVAKAGLLAGATRSLSWTSEDTPITLSALAAAAKRLAARRQGSEQAEVQLGALAAAAKRLAIRRQMELQAQAQLQHPAEALAEVQAQFQSEEPPLVLPEVQSELQAASDILARYNQQLLLHGEQAALQLVGGDQGDQQTELVEPEMQEGPAFPKIKHRVHMRRVREQQVPAKAVTPISHANRTLLDEAIWMLPTMPWKPTNQCIGGDAYRCLSGFAIQGKVNKAKRNYTRAFVALQIIAKGCLNPEPGKELANNCKVLLKRCQLHVVGASWSALDVPSAVAELVKRTKNLNFQQFYDVIHHTLTLIPTLAVDSFFDRKFSSTVVTSIITATPMVAQPALLGAYTFLNSSHVVMAQPKEALSTVLKRVLAATPEELMAPRMALYALRDRLNREALAKFSKLLLPRPS